MSKSWLRRLRSWGGRLKRRIFRGIYDRSARFEQLERSVDVLLRDAEANRPLYAKKRAISTADLYQMYGELGRRHSEWNRCGLVLCCPLTVGGTKRLFTKSQIKCISSVEELFSMCASELNTDQVELIGISSPWVLEHLYRRPVLLALLVQRCRHGILFLLGDDLDDEAIHLRQRFHQAGCSEIGIIEDSGLIEASTVGVLPGGDFNLHCRMPGLPRTEGRWLTHIAGRVSLSHADDDLWRTVVGCPRYSPSEDLSQGVSNAEALLIRSPGGIRRIGGRISVQGVARWNDSRWSGSIGLIACYSGLEDNRMYAAEIELLPSSKLVLSLRRQDGAWASLGHAAVPITNLRNVNGACAFPFWLSVTSTEVSAGSDCHTLITCSDAVLPRVQTAGIRMLDDAAAVSGLSINFWPE